MSPKLANNLINRVIVTVRHEMTISVSKTVTTNSAMDSAAVVVIIINVIIKDNVNRDDRLVMGELEIKCSKIRDISFSGTNSNRT